jgi:hypothetical protein
VELSEGVPPAGRSRLEVVGGGALPGVEAEQALAMPLGIAVV